MITVKDLCKDYRVNKEKSGAKNLFNSLIKREYETMQAVKNLNFHISEGEIAGLIGPNGAGKSTTIRMLSGILSPTSGILRINGIDPYVKRIENLKTIGCVFGSKTQLWHGMPVFESFEMVRHIYKISNKIYKENIQLFSDILGIGDFLHITPDKLSLGQRMRADFACTMLHNPSVVYLDEPTIGLDVIAKERIFDFLNEINKVYKTTILLITHNVEDVEKICSRVMIMDKGRLIYDGRPERMKSIFSSDHTLQVGIDTLVLPDLQDLPIKKYTIENNNLSIIYDSRIINSSAILSHIVGQCQIKYVKMYEPRLIDIIHKIYEDSDLICSRGSE